MGKSFRDRREADFDDDNCEGEGTIYVALDDIFITDATVAKLMARDGAQIEQYRKDYEYGARMVRVVLRPRVSGGYNIEDGRHRVIAAKFAGTWFHRSQSDRQNRRLNSAFRNNNFTGSLLQNRLDCQKWLSDLFCF